MGLPKVGSASWQAEVEEVASQFRKATISIYDLTQTGTDGKPAAVVSRRPARVQHVRTAGVFNASSQQTAKRSFVFEVALNDGDPIIKKDMLIRVHDGGLDPQLERYGFTVISSAGSSESALRTIEAVTEFAILPAVP